MDANAVAGPSGTAGSLYTRIQESLSIDLDVPPALSNGHDSDSMFPSNSGPTGRRFVRASSAPHSQRYRTIRQTSDTLIVQSRRLPTGYCYSKKMLSHKYLPDDDGDTHPEKPERISRIYEKFIEGGVISRMKRIAVREAIKEEAMLVHSGELWDRINSFADQPYEFYAMNKQFFNKLSLYVNEHTAVAARFSLGGVIETCRAVADGRVGNAFAIVRPPGHHSEPQNAMGFCFYNNVAVAANYLKTVYKDQGIKRILILDWDVHHGNGTQKAFWTDPDVLYISIHRHEGGNFYPGGPYGGADMVGGQNAKGRCVNIPWPSGGMTDADYLYAFQKIVMPIAYEFAPDFVLVSAGFDAAAGDTLGECFVSPAGYAHMTHMLSGLANGRMVVALEGGYNVEAIASSALECVKILLGDVPQSLPQLKASSAATRTVHLVTAEQSPYWDNIQPTYRKKEDYIDFVEADKFTPVAELMKAYRTHYLFHEHGLFHVPIANPVLDEMFRHQLLVSPNVYRAKTVVLFVHDMGELVAQLNPQIADIDLEKSFWLDTSSKVIEWIGTKNWAIIDINLVAHSETVNMLDRSTVAKKERELVIHAWDQIIQLQDNIENIILIGQGIGCQSIVHLLNERTIACREHVKAAIQIFDLNLPYPLLPNSERAGLRTWFHSLSMAIFPMKHIIFADDYKIGKRYGNVVVSTESQPSRVLHDKWEDIRDFVQTKLLETSAGMPENATRLANGTDVIML